MMYPNTPRGIPPLPGLTVYHSLFTLLLRLTNSKKKKKIGRFSIESVVSAKHMECVLADCLSRLEYYCIIDSHFCVLSDQRTVLGVGFATKNAVFKENIRDRSAPVVTFNGSHDNVFTLALDERCSTVFAGQFNNGFGRVVQYDLDTGRLLRDYGKLGMGSIESSASFGSLQFFGGYLSHSFLVIDAVGRSVVHGPVRTAVENIYSLAVCQTEHGSQESKVILVVTGPTPDYLQSRTDKFDITQLVKSQSNLRNRLGRE